MFWCLLLISRAGVVSRTRRSNTGLTGPDGKGGLQAAELALEVGWRVRNFRRGRDARLGYGIGVSVLWCLGVQADYQTVSLPPPSSKTKRVPRACGRVGAYARKE